MFGRACTRNHPTDTRPTAQPVAGEPGEPFDLTLWRGQAPTVVLRVRAYTRRLAGGQPVGLLLIQDDSKFNESLKEKTGVAVAVENEIIDLNKTLALREQELDEHEIELAALRAELQEFYAEKAREAGRPLKAVPKPPAKPTGILNVKGAPASQQRVAWGAPNKVGHFTKGSSPREFGNKVRHDAMRAEALGQPPPQ